MNISNNWYEKSGVKNTCTRGKAMLFPNVAEIALNENYSVNYVGTDITDFDSTRYIEIDIDVINENSTVYLYAEWYKDNNEIYKEYIKKEATLEPYEDADKLTISALVCGQDNGYAKITLKNVKTGNKVFHRKAKVAALTIPYGFVSEHKNRTCEDNLNDTLNKIDSLVSSEKIDLIVLTETFYSRNITVDFFESCLYVDSPQIDMLRNKAKEHKLYLAFSFREKDKLGQLYNSCVIVDRNGDIIAHYHKTHLTTGEKIAGLVPGNEYAVVDCDFGRVGIAICWDLYYPEFVRSLVKQGVDVIINPTAGFKERMHRQRAEDNGVYIVTAGVWPNNAVVINPQGDIMADGIMTGVAVAEIDVDKKYPQRYLSVSSFADRKNVYFNEMRDDMYIGLYNCGGSI